MKKLISIGVALLTLGSFASHAQDQITDAQVFEEMNTYLTHLNGSNNSEHVREQQLTFLKRIKDLWKIPEFRRLRAMPLSDILKLQLESPNPYFVTAVAFHDDFHPICDLPHSDSADMLRIVEFREKLRLAYSAKEPIYIDDDARELLVIHPELKYVIYSTENLIGIPKENQIYKTEVILQDLNTEKYHRLLYITSGEGGNVIAAMSSDGNRVALFDETNMLTIYDTSSFPPQPVSENHLENKPTPSLVHTPTNMHFINGDTQILFRISQGRYSTYNLHTKEWTDIYEHPPCVAHFFDQNTMSETEIELEDSSLFLVNFKLKYQIPLLSGKYEYVSMASEAHGTEIAVHMILPGDNEDFVMPMRPPEHYIFIYENPVCNKMPKLVLTDNPLAMAFHPTESLLYVITSDGMLNVYDIHTRAKVFQQDLTEAIHFNQGTEIPNFFFFDHGNQLAIVTQDEEGLYNIHQLQQSLPSLNLLYLIDPESLNEGEKK